MRLVRPGTPAAGRTTGWIKEPRANNKYTRALAMCLLGAAALADGSSAVTADEPRFVRIRPAEVQWRAVPGGHGVQMAILQGDPGNAGLYVIRVKFPPHVMDLPHRHPHVRYVTVLQGTWYTGTGDTFDPARAVPLKPGSFMVHPAGAAHWDGSAGDETVIVEVTGEGPATMTPVDAGRPDWTEVHRP